MNNKSLIVAHGDLDGIISATLLAEQLGISAEDIKVIFTQPFLVDKVEISDEIEKIYVVDIAINNRDPQMTQNFIESLGDQLIRWYDHHEGWPPYKNPIKGLPDPFASDMYRRRKIYHEEQTSCAEVIGGNKKRVADAIVADTRKGELSESGQLIEQACKANLQDDSVRVAAVKWLLGDENQKLVLEKAAEKYVAVLSESDRLALEYYIDGRAMPVRSAKMYHECGKYPFGTIAFVDATDSTHNDLTQLLLTGQELATFAVAKVIDSRSDEEMITIATKSGTNLVELFKLPSGAPFRVTLPADRLEEVMEKLHNLDPNFRYCQCGSGEPWATCQAGSQYCG